MQFTAPTDTHQWILFITAYSVDDRDEEKRREQNLRSGKSEAGV